MNDETIKGSSKWWQRKEILELRALDHEECADLFKSMKTQIYYDDNVQNSRSRHPNSAAIFFAMRKAFGKRDMS